MNLKKGCTCKQNFIKTACSSLAVEDETTGTVFLFWWRAEAALAGAKMEGGREELWLLLVELGKLKTVYFR